MEELLQQMLVEWPAAGIGERVDLFRLWLTALLLESSGAELAGVETDASIPLDTEPYHLQISPSGGHFLVGPIISLGVFEQDTAELAVNVGELIAVEVEAYIHHLESHEAWLEAQERLEDLREHMEEIYERMAEDAEHYHDHDHPDHDEHEHEHGS